MAKKIAESGEGQCESHEGSGEVQGESQGKNVATLSVWPRFSLGGKNKNRDWWLIFAVIMVLTFSTRFYQIDQPPWVCWDETHFGKFGSYYINRTFFFDVHPPLGKMFIGGIGYLTGYNGTFPFEKPGDKYHDHAYTGMRVGCALLGTALIPFSFLTVWELTRSLTAATTAAILVLFDIGMLTLNRFILLDPPLLFFISAATYCMVKFRTYHNVPFSMSWWTWLAATGVAIGGAISVKFVGLFVVLLVGINTIEQLWDIFGDTSQSLLYSIKHFAARALCLIALPIVFYVLVFAVHLQVLYKSGPGDGHFSSSFQSSLDGNFLNNASLPRETAFGAIVTLKNQRTGGGYLHSHMSLYPEGVGAKQQQVTLYGHKDVNNKFLIKKFEGEPYKMYTPEWEEEDVELVRHGDLIRLEHVATQRNVHAHQEAAPMSKKMFQVTGYGENGTGDANDVWRVVIENGNDGDVLQTVTTKFRLQHYFLKCCLAGTAVQLPTWGHDQNEVACNPTCRGIGTDWNVEDNTFSKLPNSSYSQYAPGFIMRFIESHAVMLTGNSGLKPKEGEVTSRPWEWPITWKGQFFSGNDQRIYLMGNPIIWWGNLLFLCAFLLAYSWDAIREQRGGGQSEEKESKEWREQTLSSCIWLFLGWALHYVPFWAMGRVLYFHHYFPALLYSNMITAIMFNFILNTFTNNLPKSISSVAFHVVSGSFFALWTYSFVQFSPLAYGAEATPGAMENSTVHHLKWLNSWEF